METGDAPFSSLTLSSSRPFISREMALTDGALDRSHRPSFINLHPRATFSLVRILLRILLGILGWGEERGEVGGVGGVGGGGEID